MRRPDVTYRWLLVAVFLSLAVGSAFAQSRLYVPLVRETNMPLMHALDTIGTNFHPAIRPYQTQDVDSLPWYNEVYKSDFFGDKFLLNLNLNKKSENSKIKLILLPIGELTGGFQSGDVDKSYLQTAIGFNFSAMVGKKLEINFNFLRSNSSFPSFVESYIFDRKIVPGQGWGNETDLGYQYKNSNGFISYSPAKFFNVTVGRGKNFIGEGYRSLLLSDFANNYHYVRLTTSIWKIKYVNLFTSFKDIYNLPDAPGNYRQKYGAFHYLSINLTRRWNIGLFEGIIWQGNDSTFNRGYDVNYLNPIIFLRPVEYSLGSSDNALMGLNTSVRIVNSLKMYGQLLLDEFLLREMKSNSGWWGNKFGTQLGVKYYDAFTIKRLSLVVEWNMMRPYTYSHDNSVQAYGHWNEPLAHPSGANFNEVVIMANYYVRRFNFELKQTFLNQGLDVDSLNYGANIFESNTTRVQDFDNRVGQGLKRILSTTQFKASWLISTRANIRLEGELSYWREEIQGQATSNIFWASLGIRTGLFNRYWDF